jgi:hypothetical protein
MRNPTRTATRAFACRCSCQTDFVDVWPSPFPMPNMVQAVAANGGRVGFFHVAGFEGDQQPIASFKYIKLENVQLAYPSCPQDVTGDGVVDDADLLEVLFSFGASADPCTPRRCEPRRCCGRCRPAGGVVQLRQHLLIYPAGGLSPRKGESANTPGVGGELRHRKS